MWDVENANSMHKTIPIGLTVSLLLVLPLTADADPGVATVLERSAYTPIDLPQDVDLVGPDPTTIALNVFGTQEPVEGNFFEDVFLAEETPDLAIVGFTQMGLPDDAVRGMRYRLEFVPNGNQWRLDWAGRQVQCYPGRGSEDWTTANCS